MASGPSSAASEPHGAGARVSGATTTSAAPEWQFNAVQGVTVADGARLRHVVANAELVVRDGRLVGGTGYRQAKPDHRRELARAGAILRLRQRHRYHVHAAGVVDGAGRAWLLAGPTGSGKSTLAYALSRAGWTVLGEDGVIVEVHDGQPVIALGWREPVRVSRSLSTVFPELAGDLATSRAIPGDPRQRTEMPVPVARRAPVVGLVWIQHGQEDRMTPRAPTEALVDLIRESAWVLIADGGARAHLEALRRLVTDVPSYRLVHSSLQLRDIAHTLRATGL
jgi:hypothetical protein